MPVCLQNDPDKCAYKDLLQILQTLYIVTSCDYMSFFKGIRKQTFMKTLFRFAEFISGSHLAGSLANTDPELRDTTFFFLDFLVYF